MKVILMYGREIYDIISTVGRMPNTLQKSRQIRYLGIFFNAGQKISSKTIYRNCRGRRNFADSSVCFAFNDPFYEGRPLVCHQSRYG